MDLTRLKQAHTAVKAISGGPDGAAAWFSAYALSLSQENLADLAGTLGAGHAALKDALGGWRAPSGHLRWIYAALLVGNGKSVSDFLALRDALREKRKELGAGKLYAVSTVGSILGTIGTSFFLILWLGTKASMTLLGTVLAILVIAAGACHHYSHRKPSGKES